MHDPSKPSYQELLKEISDLKQKIQQLEQLEIKYRQSEYVLLESKERYRSLVDNIDFGINLIDKDFTVIATNAAFEKLLKKPTSDIVGKKCFQEFEKRQEVCKHCPGVLAMATGQTHQVETKGIRDDGSSFIARVLAYPLIQPDGTISGFNEVVEDITERKQAEIIMIAQRDLSFALTEGKTLQDALHICLENAITLTEFDAGAIFDIDSVTGHSRLACIIGFSDSHTKLAKQDRFSQLRHELMVQGIPYYIEAEEITTLPFREALLEESIKSIAFIPIKMEAQIIGGLIVASHVADRIAPYVRNALVAIASQIGIAISKAKSDEALRESERKFRDLAEKSPVGIFLIQDHVHKYVNTAFAKIIGYQAEEIVDRMGTADIVCSEDLPLLAEGARQYENGELQYRGEQYRFKTKNNEIRIVETFSSRTVYQGRPAIIGTLLDVTDRQKSEEELRRLSIAIEQAAEEIIITDPNWIIQYVNPAFENITGYSRAEAIGKTPSFLRSGAHKPEFYKDLNETINAGKIWRGRIINKRKDGKLIHEDTTISPLIASVGKLMGYVTLKRDVTETVGLEAHLRQAQKMEAIGTLAGGIAHDFNNILAAMMGYAELSKIKTKDREIYPYLDQILKACQRSRDLVEQILAFSRQREQEMKPVVVIPIVKEAMKLLRSSIPSTIEIRQHYDAKQDTIFADPTQVHQILMNLCTNAVHAMRNKEGLLEVSIGQKEIGTADLSYEPDFTEEGAYLTIIVRDTGVGIDPAIKDKIFDPFFTTKGTGEGTGLGLSVVYGIVKNLGGAISVASEIGRGTIFTIYLPLIHVHEKLAEKETLSIPEGEGRVLYVDDEESIASLGKDMLSSLGYDVTVHLSSLGAMKAFRANPDQFDLVITDMTMPGMTGANMAREMLKIRPGIPIILTTGFSERINEDEAKKIGIREFLMKPVSLPVLAAAVKRIMDQRDTSCDSGD